MPEVTPSIYADKPKPTGRLVCGLPFEEYAALPYADRMQLLQQRQLARGERQVRVDEKTTLLMRMRPNYIPCGKCGGCMIGDTCSWQ